jgi:hypothetical protein
MSQVSVNEVSFPFYISREMPGVHEREKEKKKEKKQRRREPQGRVTLLLLLGGSR